MPSPPAPRDVPPSMDGKTRHLRVYPPVITFGNRCGGPTANTDANEHVFCPGLNHAEGNYCNVFQVRLSRYPLASGVRVAYRGVSCLDADKGQGIHEQRIRKQGGLPPTKDAP